MPSITIKNIPDQLYNALKKSAALHHRSMNGEVLHHLEFALLPRLDSRQKAFEELARVRREIGPIPHLTPEEIKEAIEEGRE